MFAKAAHLDYAPRHKAERPPRPLTEKQLQTQLLTQMEEALKQDDPAAMNRAMDALFEQLASRPEFRDLGKIAAAKAKASNLKQQAGDKANVMVAWVLDNPGKAAVIMAGLIGMIPLALVVAPFVASTATAVLGPVVGETAATILGTGAGGALASGSRSLYVNAIPMHLLEIDEENNKQLATDVAMSTGFGFLGFAQAETLAVLVGALGGAPVLAVIAINLVGLVGYEVAKDLLQNAIRNRVASEPKTAKEILGQTIKMETWSNAVRAHPSLSKSFLLKMMLDIGSTVAWNRIVNKRNGAGNESPAHQLSNIRFDLNMRIIGLHDDIMELNSHAQTPEEKQQVAEMIELRRYYMKEVRPRLETLHWDIK